MRQLTVLERSIYTVLNEINADLNFNYNFRQPDLPKPAILLDTNNRSVGKTNPVS